MFRGRQARGESAAGVTFGLLQDDVVVAGSGLKKVNDTKQPEETKTTYTDEDGKAKPWREAVPGPVGDLFGRVAGAKGTSLDPATHVEQLVEGDGRLARFVMVARASRIVPAHLTLR